MIDTTHNNIHFSNQIIRRITRSGVIDQEKINLSDLCYQCYRFVSEFLFGKLRIRDYREEPHFPAKISLLSSQIQMNTLFKNNDEIK